ncbi:hypothetical protein SNE40_010168 [Patella caerulea]|uniref:Uncharacterized protein n=1 Tax=Patella caerulea TaxID=87958 RepID=A0AAN8PSJ4_PATCE
MFKVIIACAFLSYVAAQKAGHTQHPHTQHPHTQHPHSTHAPAIHDNFHFIHDAEDNKMIIKTETECYVFDLNAAQQTAIATPTGLRATELALVAMISTGTQTHIKAADLPQFVAHHCGKHKVVGIQ